MIETWHLIKVAMAWISILYVVCFGAVALYPDIRLLFARYAFHAEMSIGENIVTVMTFVIGLVLWNVVTVLGVGLFAVLFNRIK